MNIKLEDKGLRLPLASGQGYFNYFWLRDNDPTSIDPVTNERVFDISGLEGDPLPEEARMEENTLVIRWKGEPLESRFPLDWLDAWGETAAPRDPAMIPRRAWQSGSYEQWARVSQPALDSDPAERAKFARALIEDGIALVRDMEDSDEGLTRLTQVLGPITPCVDGYYFDVKLHINPTNLAYTAGALEMHTDLPSEEAAPGVQFLHCRRNSVQGGLSMFVDGVAVAEALKAEDPEAFELLASHDIPFMCRHDGWDYRAHQRVIELDARGEVSGVTVSQHLADVFDLPQDLLDRYYPAFCKFLKMLRSPEFMNTFRLNAGECIVFDNHRVVHGREAFVATSGERHLRGCYVDRGALRSTYRTLVKQGY